MHTKEYNTLSQIRHDNVEQTATIAYEFAVVLNALYLENKADALPYFLKQTGCEPISEGMAGPEEHFRAMGDVVDEITRILCLVVSNTATTDDIADLHIASRIVKDIMTKNNNTAVILSSNEERMSGTTFAAVSAVDQNSAIGFVVEATVGSPTSTEYRRIVVQVGLVEGNVSKFAIKGEPLSEDQPKPVQRWMRLLINHICDDMRPHGDKPIVKLVDKFVSNEVAGPTEVEYPPRTELAKLNLELRGSASDVTASQVGIYNPGEPPSSVSERYSETSVGIDVPAFEGKGPTESGLVDNRDYIYETQLNYVPTIIQTHLEAAENMFKESTKRILLVPRIGGFLDMCTELLREEGVLRFHLDVLRQYATARNTIRSYEDVMPSFMKAYEEVKAAHEAIKRHVNISVNVE